MPIASTDDLLVAITTDMHHVLVSPPNGIPLSHLPPSTTETLVKLTETLMQPSLPTSDKLTQKAKPLAPAPPLRVAPQEPAIAKQVTPAPPLRVPTQEPPHQGEIGAAPGSIPVYPNMPTRQSIWTLDAQRSTRISPPPPKEPDGNWE
jgi:hypothetical protein